MSVGEVRHLSIRGGSYWHDSEVPITHKRQACR